MAKSGFRRTKALISLKRSKIGAIGNHVRTFDSAEFNDLDEILMHNFENSKKMHDFSPSVPCLGNILEGTR